MVLQKSLSRLLIIGFLISLNASFTSAQDVGNCGSTCSVGDYNFTETLIINGIGSHTFGNTNGLNHNTLGGFNHTLQSSSSSSDVNFIYGEGNVIDNTKFSATLGSTNIIDTGESSMAFGEAIELLDKRTYGMGTGVKVSSNRAMAFGFGNPNTPSRLQGIGSHSITMGIDAQNVFNILLNSNSNPVTGIGTTSPGTDKLRIVGNGTGTNAALNVQNSNNVNRLKVRNDGWTGFSSNPSAPFFFTETSTSPFQSGNDGKANMVQNYAAFPNFKNVGPFNNNDSAKWLALGERPPASSTSNNDQVAYGLANVWQNNAANFVLLDQSPGTSGQTAEKDLAITFQDVWNQSSSSALTDPANAGNRIRFLFRNSRDIDTANSTFELMSLEPTGEVAVGDYTNSTQQANLEVKADTQNTLSPIFQVRRNGTDSTRGDDVFTVSDSGFVGINRTSVNNINQNVQLTVDGQAENSTASWLSSSDRRLKKNIKPFEDGLKTLMEIKPKWYQYNEKSGYAEDIKHVGIIAQEMKKIAPYMIIENKNGYLGYNPNALRYLLVNSVQQQQKQLKDEQAKNDSMRQVLKNQQEQLNNQQQQIDNQQEQIDQLRERLNSLAQQKEGNANRFKKSDNLNEKTVVIPAEDNQKQAMLLQNRPNPYSGETVIPYYLPETFEKANMLITNTNGQIIKRIALENAGKGELTLRTDGLKAGQYLYSLIVDGRKIQTRKMVLNKR